MSLPVKLVISLVIAVIAYTLTSLVGSGAVNLLDGEFSFPLLLAFVVSTVATALLVRDPSPAVVATAGTVSSTAPAPASAASGDRETGEVKWFNVSKGFGFIIKDDGEEIFVHFRSIRGQGRRGLRDGQRVSFVVEDSEKGPQAEDVVPED